MCLIEVDVDPFQLKGTVTFIDARCIESMFITDDFPKLLRQWNKRTGYIYVGISALNLKQKNNFVAATMRTTTHTHNILPKYYILVLKNCPNC